MTKKIAIVFLIMIMIILLCSCGTFKGQKEYTEKTDNLLKQTDISDCLYYDVNTKVVYIIWNEKSGSAGYGYMSPYISSNGKPYIYDVFNNSLIEIESEE